HAAAARRGRDGPAGGRGGRGGGPGGGGIPGAVGSRAPPMPKRLVIVESPAKARTIAGYLGSDFVVESSVGHIRDLPDSAAEIPERYKGESWARLGVNVEEGFEPLYVVDPDKKKTVAQLRKQLADADELLLATEEDREVRRSPGTCSRC